MSRRYFADDFERSNRPLRGDVAPTGDVWHSYGRSPDGNLDDPTNEGQIFDGAVATPHAGASYSWAELGEVPDSVTLTFTLGPGTSYYSAAGVIISNLRAPANGVEIAQSSVHVSAGNWGTVIAIYDNPRSFEHAVYTHGFETSLVADGATEYAVTVRRAGDTITVVNADGSVGVFSHPLVSDLWGSTVLVEPFRPAMNYATDGEPRIAGVSADRIRSA